MIFFTGSYTQAGAPALNPIGKGINCFDFDEETGEIRFMHTREQRNPSCLVVSPDKRYLYATEEMFRDLNPAVYAYSISDTGELGLINSQPLSGDYACHLAVIANQLVIANYVSGNVLSYPIRGDGSLESLQQVIQHVGAGPHKERQDHAHPHMIYPYRANQMFVVDLGIDQVRAYEYLQSENLWKEKPGCDIVMPAGVGLRHMVMDKHEKIAYVLSELSGEVFVVKAHASKFEPVQQISILPEGFGESFAGAAIRRHPKGKYLYTSCRGADVVTVFRIIQPEGTLERAGLFSTAGKIPRDFNITPSGKWLIAANQDSNELVVFKLNQETGSLKKHKSVYTGSPVNICWR